MRPVRLAVLGTVCALAIGVHIWCGQSGVQESSSANAKDSYYNLLVQGFRTGKLYLTLPARFAKPGDPTIPTAGEVYQSLENVHDLSYYGGKFYLYLGVTPALVLFWPYAWVTGHYLLHRDAVVFLCGAGFLASAGLLIAVWRRYFQRVSMSVVVAGIAAMGLAGGTPLLVASAGVYEVPISCGYALTMVSLILVWKTLHDCRHRCWWLAGAGLTYGLAVGARPSLLFGGVIVLIPVFRAWREKQAGGLRLFAAGGPMVIIGLGLMLYNTLRFDHLLEFGQRFQLPMREHEQFSLRYLWFNFRVGFLEPAFWGSRFPFVQGIVLPPSPMNYFMVENAFGVLSNLPLVWWALAPVLPFRICDLCYTWPWRCKGNSVRGTESPCLHDALQWFLTAVVFLFVAVALPLLLHDSMCLRYQVEFVMPLLWLSVLGMLGLQQILADQPVRRRAGCAVLVLLLSFSVAFNLLARFTLHADTEYNLGDIALRKGQLDEAVHHYYRALELQPRLAMAHNNLGNALLRKGHNTEAVVHLQMAAGLQPADATTHLNLGNALQAAGQLDEALDHFQKALQIRPDFALACYNLGNLLLQKGRPEEAVVQFRRAITLQPDMAPAYVNLGNLLFVEGQVDEAIKLYQQALKYRPDSARAYTSLGHAEVSRGNASVAMTHFQAALDIQPDQAARWRNLAWLLATCADDSIRNGARAVVLAQRANQLAGGKDAGILDTLAAAYAEAGRFEAAVQTAQMAIELAKATGQTNEVQRIQERLRLYQTSQSYHEATTSAR